MTLAFAVFFFSFLQVNICCGTIMIFILFLNKTILVFFIRISSLSLSELFNDTSTLWVILCHLPKKKGKQETEELTDKRKGKKKEG